MGLVKCFRCQVILGTGTALVLEVRWTFPDGEEVVQKVYLCPGCGPLTRYRLTALLNQR